MRRLAGLLLVGVVALALGALVTSGALKAPDAPAASNQPRAGAASEKPVSTLRPSVAAATCFDYNGPAPGRGWPWLIPIPIADLGTAAPTGLGNYRCVPGLFKLDSRAYQEDLGFLYFVSGLRLGADGCPLDPLDVYRRAIAVDPWLGGSGRPLTEAENSRLGTNMSPEFQRLSMRAAACLENVGVVTAILDD